MREDRLAKVAIILAAGMIALRLILSAAVGLGDDESYYWDWSRHMALSYYDHPGMVAWLIRLGTDIFGQNSFAVRFFGVVCGALGAVFLWKTAIEMFDRRVASASLILYVLAPILSVGGLLMVPDAPMAAAWMGFTYLLWRLWSRPDASWTEWIAAGVVLGLGFLSKYTIVLCAVSGVALFTFSPRRNEFARSKIYVAILIAAVLCLPIVLWNIQYDWPSLKFHLKERQSGGGGANFNRWLQYFVSQAVALGPVLFFACVAGLVASFRRLNDRRWFFIALVSSPPLFIFTAQALFAEFKPHWPVPAYPLLFIGVSALYFEWRERQPKSLFRQSLIALLFFYFALLNILAPIALVSPVIPKLARVFAPGAEWDPKFDPTNDMYGWDAAVAEANRLRDGEEKKTGERPFLSSSRYQLVSQIAFASQEDVARVIPTKDEYSFVQDEAYWTERLGKSSIFIVDHRYDRDPRRDRVFEKCTQRPDFYFDRGSERSRIFKIWICRGFKGVN
ncbi:MAG TPA: glycosyltransferase family 39 protein [Bdellovibrionales bacterium]|nr:glycosyltransferase family 39 protein [Bdellovibrionales bacterium]